MREVWEKVNGYENYEVSSHGKVRKNYATSTIILKPMINEYGYASVDLWENGKRKRHKIHRLVAIAFLPNPMMLNEVNHIDGNKLNNRMSNLQWCTRSENIKHAYRTNLTHGRRLLSTEEIAFVKEHYKKRDDKYNAYKLAAMFNVKPYVIYNVIYGITSGV